MLWKRDSDRLPERNRTKTASADSHICTCIDLPPAIVSVTIEPVRM